MFVGGVVKSSWQTHLCLLVRPRGTACSLTSLAGALQECSVLLFPRLSFVCDCRVRVGLMGATLAVVAGVVSHVVVVSVMRGWSEMWWWSEVCDSRVEGGYGEVGVVVVVKSSDRIGEREAVGNG